MTLGDCIREYRQEHLLSQRQFAESCDLSNAYISILEKNLNPKTNEAPAPSYGVYEKIARAMGISIHELMEKADESTVSLGSSMTLEAPSLPFHPDVISMIDKSISERQRASENRLLELFATMTDSDKDRLLDYAQYIAESYKRPDKRR